MDWAQVKEFAGYIVAAIIFGGGGGYLAKRNLKKDAAVDEASDTAEAIYKRATKFAEDKFQEVLRENTKLRAELLEFRNKTNREFGYVQKFNRETAGDLRKLARSSNMDEVQLDTQIYNTGMGPLDP